MPPVPSSCTAMMRSAAPRARSSGFRPTAVSSSTKAAAARRNVVIAAPREQDAGHQRLFHPQRFDHRLIHVETVVAEHAAVVGDGHRARHQARERCEGVASRYRVRSGTNTRRSRARAAGAGRARACATSQPATTDCQAKRPTRRARAVKRMRRRRAGDEAQTHPRGGGGGDDAGGDIDRVGADQHDPEREIGRTPDQRSPRVRHRACGSVSRRRAAVPGARPGRTPRRSVPRATGSWRRRRRPPAAQQPVSPPRHPARSGRRRPGAGC